MDDYNFLNHSIKTKVYNNQFYSYGTDVYILKKDDENWAKDVSEVDTLNVRLPNISFMKRK